MSNAEIVIHWVGKDESVSVQYNPPEYSLGWSVKYSIKPNLAKDEKKEFIGEEKGTLSFKLTIDGFTKAVTDDEAEAADVSEDVEKLKKFMIIDEKLHKPPECTFKWGPLQFRGVVEKLAVRYTMFSADGKPIRAAVDITISQSVKKNIPLQSPDRTKRRVLAEDTELFMVANEAYDDPAAWRPIATANGIKNPRLLETGMVLRVPPLEETP